MDILIFLLPTALLMGLVGLAAFLWAMKTGQFDDLEGDAARILYDDETPAPVDAPRGKKA
ncbi:cbb3-type cytochrome oxidase assembly protein CcoS [Zavarzinia sp.]|uniref:cbb3-type cytochrome oxidase assembly protein CcoS n=1 Tax=Zavarzinia sp. TaxID=2027920 RepID=UPI00356AC086